MPCPLCQQENPASQKFCGECGTSLVGPNPGGPPAASNADLRREVARLTRALSESIVGGIDASELRAVHALKHHEVAARIKDRDHHVPIVFLRFRPSSTGSPSASRTRGAWGSALHSTSP